MEQRNANQEVLGEPMNLKNVAKLIGCSVWTVRQVLVPNGLPHWRSKPSGKMVFYRHQVVRWILNHQQKGGNMK